MFLFVCLPQFMYRILFTGCSGLVVSASDCGVRGPRFESHRSRLYPSLQLLWYTALGTGCTLLLHCLGWLSLPPSASSVIITSQLGQLSLASLRGRLIEYRLRQRWHSHVTSAGWQVTLCDLMWHVSSRSGVATLRTAIHLLFTC